MKKVLALILCALMIVTAALPVFAEGAEPETNTPGPLAITEVCARSPSEGYGYLEILNTSDTDIDLSGYYLFRFGFSNSYSNLFADGLKNMLGLSNAQAWGGVAAIKLNGTVKAHDVVVVILSDKYTEEAFITYWNGLGANLTADKVIDFDFATDTNLTSSSIHGSSYHDTHKNFLPRNSYGMCTLALVPVADAGIEGNPATFFDKAAGDKAETEDIDETHEVYSSTYLNVADCIVALSFMNTTLNTSKTGVSHKNMDTGSAVFTDFIKKESFNASVDATVYPETVTKKTIYYYDDLYPALAVSEPTLPCEAYTNVKYGNDYKGEKTTAAAFANYTYPEGVYPWLYNKGDEAIPMPKVAYAAHNTPGKLDGVQYGHGTEVTTNNTNGLTMTEVYASTSKIDGYTGNYEFIEVKNTTASNITLSNYSIALLGGTNSGKYEATFVKRVLNTPSSLGGGDVEGGEWSYAEIQGTTVLEPGAVAVISFNDNNIDDFKNFWTARGNDMTGVTVVNATYSVGAKISARGQGFMPDAAVGYSISLFNDTKTTEISTLWSTLKNDIFNKAETYKEDGETPETYFDVLRANVNTIVSNADSVTLILQRGKNEQNVSINYYNYVDPVAYNAAALDKALDLMRLASANITQAIFAIEDNLNLLVAKDQPLGIYSNTSVAYGPTYVYDAASATSIVTADAPFDSVPTPGTLLDGQFGYEADDSLISVSGYQTATTATNGATDVRVIGKLNVAEADLGKYSAIGIEVAAASRATDTYLNAGGNSSDSVIANTICTKWEKEISTDKVYKKLTDEAGTEYTNGDNYMFAINLAGIPVENCNLTFRVYVVENGVKTYTGFYQITDTSI